MAIIKNIKNGALKVKILITGINGTLGQVIAKELCNNPDYELIGTDYHSCLECTSAGKIEYYPCDLSDFEQINKLADLILQIYGGVHVLINNAAIKDFGSLDLLPPSRIIGTIHVNLLAPMLLTNHFIPFMKTEKYGKIIHIASPSAFEYYEDGWLYCTSKAALAGLPYYTGPETMNSGISVHTIYPQSFIKRNGIKLQGFRLITAQVANHIKGIISGSKKKKCYAAGNLLFTLKIKLLNWLRYV